MYILTVCLYEKLKRGVLQYYDKSKQIKNSMYRSTKQANGLALIFIQSCSVCLEGRGRYLQCFSSGDCICLTPFCIVIGITQCVGLVTIPFCHRMKYVLIVFFSKLVWSTICSPCVKKKKKSGKNYYILSQGCHVCKSFVKRLFGQILLFAQMF